MTYVYILRDCRGYNTHAEPETDSDGDGGVAPKLRGAGHIEFSKKGIPHGILHFVEQLRLAGHIYMHDTCAPEACHKLYCKMAMDRARKGNELYTTISMVNWMFRRLIWSRVIYKVTQSHPKRPRRQTSTRQVTVVESKILRPTPDVAPLLRHNHFSPLRLGGHHITSNDTRITYNELATLISRCMRWDRQYVLDDLRVRLYCTSRFRDTSGESRAYWATESRYSWNGGSRRDFVEIDLGRGNFGVAQLVGFIEMDNLPEHTPESESSAIIIRWLSKSSRAMGRDNHDRPLCDYPLSFNHCLWEWSKTPRDRLTYRLRGFRGRVDRQMLWSHVRQQERDLAISEEVRARFDVIKYDSIVRHVNIAKDPTTGHMLQTLQIV